MKPIASVNGLGAERSRSAWRGFALFAVVLSLGFAVPLLDLVTFALKSDLFSHAVLVPFVSAYLVWQRRAVFWTLPVAGSAWAVVPAVFGAALLAGYWLMLRPRAGVAANDYLCLTVTAYLALLLSGSVRYFGIAGVRHAAFPLGFLVFMIPWPTVMIDGVEIGLQYASAEAADILLTLSGTPFVREGRTFQVPGITLQVAQECSGVRSSYALLITSVLASHVLLRTGWKRWALVLAVVPLGILRNGIRILTIALLCIHVSPEMVDSPIHHRGGPLFFVMSLIPFFLLLLWLRKSEAGKR